MARSCAQISFSQQRTGDGVVGGILPPGEICLDLLTARRELITLLSQPASLAVLIGTCNGLLIRSNLGSPAQRGLWGGGMAWAWGLLRVLPRRAGSVALVPALQNDVLIQHPNPAAQLAILGCCSCVCVYLCARVYVCVHSEYDGWRVCTLCVHSWCQV